MVLIYAVEDYRVLGWVRTYILKLLLCCFDATYATLRSKSKNILSRNQDTLSACSNMPSCGLLLQWAVDIQFIDWSSTKQTSLSSYQNTIRPFHILSSLFTNVIQYIGMYLYAINNSSDHDSCNNTKNIGI